MIAHAVVENLEGRFEDNLLTKMAMASITFDPVVGLQRFLSDTLKDKYHDDEILNALDYLRGYFPAEYAEAIQSIQSCLEEDAYYELLAIFNAILPCELEELEYIGGGYLPFDLWGYYSAEIQEANGWKKENFYGDRAPFYLMLEDLLDAAFSVAALQHVLDSLYEQNTDFHDNIAYLIEWIKGVSNNVLFDYAYNDEWPIDSPTIDDYELLWERTLDAEMRFKGAQLATDFIMNDPAIYANLVGNIITLIGLYTDQYLELNIKDRRYRYDDEYPKLDVPVEWVQPPERSSRFSTDAQLDNQVLRFWRDDPDERYRIPR